MTFTLAASRRLIHLQKQTGGYSCLLNGKTYSIFKMEAGGWQIKNYDDPCDYSDPIRTLKDCREALAQMQLREHRAAATPATVDNLAFAADVLVSAPDVTVVAPKLFKVLEAGHSIHGGQMNWSLPILKEDGSWEPGQWHEVSGDISVCNYGLHLTTEPYGKWMTWNADVYEAEGDGKSDTKDDKTAFRRARLLRPAVHPDWWLKAHEFVNGLKDIPYGEADGNPDPSWRLFTAPTLAAARAAARAAAWAAARAAAGAAARDAARAAARDAARAAAWDAAWDAAGAAVGDAAWDAAWDAVGDAAWDAAWDARLYITTQIICRDLDIAPEHRAHVEARWNATLKGYFVYCDVNGTLFVYAQEQDVK